MSEKQQQPYGRWQSGLSAEIVCQDSNEINFLRAGNGGVYFINSLAGAKDQLAVWHLSNEEVVSKVSADGFNVRSRVHEYGGLAYLVDGDTLYFCNFSDQRVYTQSGIASTNSKRSAPVALTPSSDPACLLRYADFVLDKKFNRLLCVREDHRSVDADNFDASKVINALVAIDLNAMGETEGEVLFEGTDFVSAPRLSPDGEMLVWQTWSHPNMPWDDTEIRLAQFDAQGKLINHRQVQQPKAGSLIQPQFDALGNLYFIADWSDWWNLYRVSAAELKAACRAEAVCPLAAEFAPAPWMLGHSSYVLLGTDAAAVSINRNGLSELGLITGLDNDSAALEILQTDFGLLENLTIAADADKDSTGDGSSNRQTIFFLAATPSVGNSIASVVIEEEGASRQSQVCYHGLVAETTVSKSVQDQRGAEISTAEIISFTTAGNQQAYGNLYLPHNSRYAGEEGSLPPLLVGVHGGPTSTAKASLNLKTQYWTNRGFAVLDVNHRGSTGFGREFRRQLYGQWGVVDLEDVMAAVSYLVDQGRVDGEKVVIHGGSAGGYSVMAALSQCELFAGGASYYGVSDLEVLAQGTHKFESRYLDQLIGPYPEAKALYQERSPIHNIEKISAPMLILQGLEDKVVPPDQALGIFEQLKARGVAVEYLPFEGEGHGFRKLENQILALETELDFYCRILHLSAALVR